MSCNCNNFIKATSVVVESTTTEDYIQITVPATVTFEEGNYCIGLFTTIPSNIQCARIEVTNGTDTYPILKCDGNNWRPCQLRCRSILRLRFLTDPDHLLIMRR